MYLHNDPIAELLQQADHRSPAPASRTLDASDLLSWARSRTIRRRGMQLTAGGMAAALLLAAVPWLRPSTPTPRASKVDIAAVMADIEQAQREADRLLQQLASQSPSNHDILAAMHPRSDVSPSSVEGLRAELAVLEAKVASNHPDADWQLEWSRSGALRLELANQDALVDPQRAADAYRQVAMSHAGTRWGRQAQAALGNIATP